jgi:hypothetical protein
MRAVKTYSQFVNESFLARRAEKKKLKDAARRWVNADSEERDQIETRLKDEGADMEEFNRYIGDAYDSQW